MNASLTPYYTRIRRNPMASLPGSGNIVMIDITVPSYCFVVSLITGHILPPALYRYSVRLSTPCGTTTGQEPPPNAQVGSSPLQQAGWCIDRAKGDQSHTQAVEWSGRSHGIHLA